MNFVSEKQTGMSLVEVVIVAAVATLVFGALLMSFKYTLDLMNVSRAKLSALSVANDRMEYFRSLPYADVGVIAGFPAGTIPQNGTTMLNGIEFAERVLVDYVDDPGDDVAGVDGNGIITDYKRIKVEYTWEINGRTGMIFLVSNIVPRSIETDEGGGTVRVNVIDENSNPLPFASVRLINNSIAPTIDIVRFTNASGQVNIAAPAGGDYEIEVTANIGGKNYSTAQTYQPTLAVPNPSVSPFAILEADISTLTFQIGELSDFNLTTHSAINDGAFKETYSSLLTLVSSSDVAINSGDLVLADSFGVYENSGFAIVGPFTPAAIESWHSIRIALDSPANTSHYAQLMTEPIPGTYTPIPDADLAGNSTGFSSSIIDISTLDPGVYPSFFVSVNLETTNTSVTPAIEELNIFYRVSATPLSGVNFNIRGNKIIGTDSASAPVYKFSAALTTDASGEVSIADLEFDEYALNFSGYDIATACNSHPIVHRAGFDTSSDIEVVVDRDDTLRVVVTDILGQLLPGVEVDLSRSGFSASEVTNNCGQVFFSGGVPVANDFDLDVVATGYNSENLTNVNIDGDGVLQITLTD